MDKIGETAPTTSARRTPATVAGTAVAGALALVLAGCGGAGADPAAVHGGLDVAPPAMPGQQSTAQAPEESPATQGRDNSGDGNRNHIGNSNNSNNDNNRLESDGNAAGTVGDAPKQAVPTVPGGANTGENPAGESREGAGAELCRAGDLELSLGRGEGATGTHYRPLRFTNTGDAPCALHGFPGVSYVAGDDGHQVGPAAYRAGTKGDPVTLQPGQVAHAPVGFVQVHNYAPADCHPTPVRGLRVYAPQETDAMYLPAPGTGCATTPQGHQLTVKTIEPGG
ncbi:DUF4232 domain-containing protein [Saccharomonospora sp. CUA-673]|uniref:DUF4232 domain-containing protein n=1 Tax=Saccharomonospora sp. CUA-673 TaxID=1904969 RepID=UPI000B20F177|nr:DUF4232 domain-containing protein [Saccharomonospora sp. CUA-673]